MTAALGLGANVLPASAAATASDSSWSQSSFQHKHQVRDNTPHDTAHGWCDSEGRYHKYSDGWGWRGDDGKWREDSDHNGSWTGPDGCRHDKDGYWDNAGHRHDNKHHQRTIR